MIVVLIIGILAAIALPAYSEYVKRARIPEAISPLADMRVKMEQYFQDNRTYVGACASGTVAPLPAATNSFTFDCGTPTATTFTVTATGRNTMTGFVYTIDQVGAKTSTAPAGWTGSTSCWIINKAGSC